MKKPVKKHLNKDNNMKDGKSDMPSRKQTVKREYTKPETPMEHDAGDQDGSAGLSGTSGI